MPLSVPMQPAKSPRPVEAAKASLRFLRWMALGTRCEVQYVCADDGLARAFETEAVNWVAAFEAKYSRFRPDSLISRINAAAGQSWVEIDPEMEQFLDLSGSL